MTKTEERARLLGQQRILAASGNSLSPSDRQRLGQLNKDLSGCCQDDKPDQRLLTDQERYGASA